MRFSFVLLLILQAASVGAEEVSLEGTYWRLTAIDGVQLVLPDPASVPHIALHAETKRVAGFGGCNRFFARYNLDAPQLTITPLGGSRINCPEQAQLEQRFIGALAEASTFAIDGRNLQLQTGADTNLTFQAVSE